MVLRFPVEEAFAFQLRADIANRRPRPAINQVVQLSPADGADVSTIAAAAPRASNGFWQPHLPAPGSAAVEDSALPDASDDWFAAKEARAFAKSAQETAICSQVCFWISLGELSALRWQSFALAKYVSCLAR
jgi:hypothetical protein